MKTRNWILLTGLVLILIVWFCYQPGTWFSSAQETGWTEPRPISERGGAGSHQELAVDAQGRVHAVWIRDLDGDGNEDVILYSVWDGIEWSEPVDVFYASQGSPFIPAIAVDPWGEVHVVFDWRGIEGIYYMHAPAELAGSAKAWSTPITINDGAHSYFSDIAVDDQGIVHAAWEDRTAPKERGEVFYSQLRLDTQGWSTPVNVSLSPLTASSHPQIVVGNQQDVWITWPEDTSSGGQPYYVRSVDAGQTWSKPVAVGDQVNERGPAPFFGVNGHLHVVWPGGAIEHIAWTGNNWSIPAVVGHPGGDVWVRGVADAADRLHVIWVIKAPADMPGDICYSVSSDGGQTWSPATVIGTGQWRADLVARLGYELIAVWGKEGRLYYSVLKTNVPAWTPAPLPPTPTPLFTATPPPAIITPTSMPALTPSSVPVSSVPPSSRGQGVYPIVLSVGVTAALISIVVAVQLRRTREQ
jgi:hypothetical protein